MPKNYIKATLKGKGNLDNIALKAKVRHHDGNYIDSDNDEYTKYVQDIHSGSELRQVSAIIC